MPIVLGIVSLDKFEKRRRIGNRLRDTFERDSLVAILGTYDAARIHGEISRLARSLATTEIKCAGEPYAAHRHAMRPPIRPRTRNPVVARTDKPLDSPIPRQQPPPTVSVENPITRHERPTSSWRKTITLFHGGPSDNYRKLTQCPTIPPQHPQPQPDLTSPVTSRERACPERSRRNAGRSAVAR